MSTKAHRRFKKQRRREQRQFRRVAFHAAQRKRMPGISKKLRVDLCRLNEQYRTQSNSLEGAISKLLGFEFLKALVWQKIHPPTFYLGMPSKDTEGFKIAQRIERNSSGAI